MATVPGVRFLPNAITVLALCAGLTSVAFALDHHWFPAIVAIGIAAILDSLDGPAARLLNSTSRIGAELDSLSDLVSFGVAPALVVYVWRFNDGNSISFGWAFCLMFAVCMALRLARFNSLLDDDTPKPYAKGFFTGIPAPGGGLLAMAPLLLAIRLGDHHWFSSQWVVAGWLVVVGSLAVSRLPTISPKSVRVPTGLIVPLLVLLVAAVALEFYEPQLVMAIGLGLYLLHLPYASWKFQYLKRHPELWMDARKQRIFRSSTRRIRLSVRMPRRRRVAGRASDGTPLPSARRRGALGQVRGRVQERRRLR
ncbi:CDP-diacylglycerol---serine O-phosphatidyltransferase [Nakamurella panacisegetis]|uniref:CDP-diacylglycerol---serine O-phosphatidyltransferase n=1 Tax=Nakamurella panacisegetis TaxID=1090615 RepID=A0A1H0JAN9_9ACTN|nr:phosphatidylcholine/phosphatidylserine synthase [Nakamurella panacisegetis]SDO40714.1 CDP-diacylglycerol---serine O-phosphatidyltransferase [Nakamurella panacisegetis]